jgi:hypothetical protein
VLLSRIIVTFVVAIRRRNGRMAPDQTSSAEMAHPLRGGVAKPRIFPQWGDCRVTEQVRCPVTGIGTCDVGSIKEITAVTDCCGHNVVVRQRAFLAVAAFGTKGGETSEKQDKDVPLGNGGRP